MAMSDRIVVMKDAKILQVDTPEALYYEPTSTAVARFVGAANVVTGRVVRSDASENRGRSCGRAARGAGPRGRVEGRRRSSNSSAGGEHRPDLGAGRGGAECDQWGRGRASVLGKGNRIPVELADRHNTLTVTSSREDSVYESVAASPSFPSATLCEYFPRDVRVHAGSPIDTANAMTVRTSSRGGLILWLAPRSCGSRYSCWCRTRWLFYYSLGSVEYMTFKPASRSPTWAGC